QDDGFAREIEKKSRLVEKAFRSWAAKYPEAKFDVRGRGMVFGIESKAFPELAGELRSKCFENRMIIETCCSRNQVLKFLAPLSTTGNQLGEGSAIISSALGEAMAEQSKKAA